MSEQEKSQHNKKPRLKIVLPNGETYKRKVIEAESHIGRGPHNEILIMDPEVSTTQARLAVNGGGCFIIDEGSEGGTFVNGERVTKPRKLASGDVIKMGKSEIIFKYKNGDKAHKDELAEAARPDTAIETKTLPPDEEAQEKEKKRHKKHKEDKQREDKHKGDKHKVKAAKVDAEAAAKASENGGKSEAEKKDKKEKKEEKKEKKEKVDERVKAARVRAWGGIIASILTVVLTVTLSIILTQQSPQTPVVYGNNQSAKRLGSPEDINKISGGKYEASGAAAVPGAKGVLFVDDSKPDQVLYMPVSAMGEQDGPVKAIPLGVSVQNPEGITHLGSRFVIIGSLSTPESNNTGGVVSFDFDPATQTASKVAVLAGLRKFLFDNVPELKAWADKTSIEGGLNIEGIAVDPHPEHPRLLLGLRGPVLNGNALVVPIKLRDRLAPLTLENLEMAEPNAIQLNLNGQAIRDMEYDPYLRAFLIISGAAENQEKADFTLWTWSGEGNQAREEARPKMQTLLDKKMKPEGIAHLKIDNQEFVFIVGDANSYTKIDYLTP